MKPNRFSAYGLNRRVLLSTLAALPTLIGVLRPTSVLAQTDPLPSWNAGPVKDSIRQFVARVTTQGPEFVPEAWTRRNRWRRNGPATCLPSSCPSSQQGGDAMPQPGTGGIDGSFGLDPNGAASYHVPLTLPPGVEVMAPSLSLVYSSNGSRIYG